MKNNFFYNGRLYQVIKLNGNHVRLKKIDKIPSACIISIENKQDIKSPYLENIINTLLEKYCLYFICVGKYCRSLHDLIDKIINEGNWIKRRREVILTTDHYNDTIDDVVFYLINLTYAPYTKLQRTLFISLRNGKDLEKYLRVIQAYIK